MNWTRTVRAAIAFAILVVLHYTLRPLLGWRANVDFLVIALLLVAVRVRPATAALVGFAIGLVSDSLTLTTFGAGAIGMTIIGFAASWLKAVVFADNLALNALFFFVGKLMLDLVLRILSGPSGGVEVVMSLLWSVLAAAVTALAGVLALVILRPLLEPAPA